MHYYPINLDIRGRNCLVIGGGGVGTRKVEMLLACGARVKVVSPAVSARLMQMADNGAVTLKKRAYRREDLEGMLLVIGATDDEQLNRRISQDADRMGTLCNIADRPEICNFILPAVVRRGDLILSISTSGKSPAMAKKLRRELEGQFGEEYGRLLDLMGAVRSKLLSREHAPESHKPLFEKLVDSDLLDMIRNNRRDDVNALLLEILGEGFTLDDLHQ